MKRKEFFELWIKALRSGEYKQGKQVLINEYDDVKRHCCLGVACEILDPKDKTSWKIEQLLPSHISKKIGIREDGMFEIPIKHRGKKYETLVDLNDDGVRFKTIARIIEEQLAAGNFSKP